MLTIYVFNIALLIIASALLYWLLDNLKNTYQEQQQLLLAQLYIERKNNYLNRSVTSLSLLYINFIYSDFYAKLNFMYLWWCILHIPCIPAKHNIHERNQSYKNNDSVYFLHMCHISPIQQSILLAIQHIPVCCLNIKIKYIQVISKLRDENIKYVSLHEINILRLTHPIGLHIIHCVLDPVHVIVDINIVSRIKCVSTHSVVDTWSAFLHHIRRNPNQNCSTI